MFMHHILHRRSYLAGLEGPGWSHLEGAPYPYWNAGFSFYHASYASWFQFASRGSLNDTYINDLRCWSASAKLWFRKLDWNKRPSEQSRHCCGRAMSVTLIAPVKTRARSSHLLSHFNVQCQRMGVSINRATTKSYILIGIVHYQPSIVGYPGTPISGHPHLVERMAAMCATPIFITAEVSDEDLGRHISSQRPELEIPRKFRLY